MREKRDNNNNKNAESSTKDPYDRVQRRLECRVRGEERRQGAVVEGGEESRGVLAGHGTNLQNKKEKCKINRVAKKTLLESMHHITLQKTAIMSVQKYLFLTKRQPSFENEHISNSVFLQIRVHQK